MSKLRPVNEVYGTRIRAEYCKHEYILLKEWMLKPLWLQYSLGIAVPTHKLAGTVSNFAVEGESLATRQITVAFIGPRKILIANRIDEPGFEYELQIVS